MQRPESSVAQDQYAECIRILRVYINACSLPIQGPHSGSLVWVTPEQAHQALTGLEASRV